MPKIGEFDLDSTALDVRIALQKKYGAFNLNHWIIEHLSVYPGLRCLDLGCGRGDQSLPLAAAIGETGAVVSVDLSEESLQALEQSANTAGFEDRIRTVHCGLDDIADLPDGSSFDRVIGSYSLYYADDAGRLFQSIFRMLVPGGILFFCGPAEDNNLELREFVAKVTGSNQPLEATSAAKFMEKTALELVDELFCDVTVSRFENPITYPSQNDLGAYWRNHNLYDPAYDEAFDRLAASIFASGSPFINKKKGIGIKATRSSRTV